MTIQTNAGTTLGVTAAGTLPTSFDAVASTGYPSETYTTVGEITDLQAMGEIYRLVTHNPIGERDDVYKKGGRGFPQISLPIALDPDDAGQTSLIASLASDSEIAVEVDHPDGAKRYFTALVMDFQEIPGSVDGIISGTCTLQQTRPVVRVAAA